MLPMTREAYRRILSASSDLELWLFHRAADVAAAEGCETVQTTHIERVLGSVPVSFADTTNSERATGADSVHRQAG